MCVCVSVCQRERAQLIVNSISAERSCGIRTHWHCSIHKGNCGHDCVCVYIRVCVCVCDCVLKLWSVAGFAGVSQVALKLLLNMSTTT